MLEELLQKLELIETKVNTILDLQTQSNALTTYNDVAAFIGVTTRTIRNYIDNGTFIEGTHFYRNQKGKITFIAEKIISFRDTPVKKENYELMNTNNIKTTKVNHPSVANLVKGLV